MSTADLLRCRLLCVCVVQAFIKTAENIYEKIKEGVYDPSREGNGVKLGVMANNAKPAKKSSCC